MPPGFFQTNRIRSGCLCILFAAYLCPGILAADQNTSEMNGDEIMSQVNRQHYSYPYVYERQSMIMADHKGNRSVRQSRQYWRIEKDESLNYLLVFDMPPEIRGVALLAKLSSNGTTSAALYLPALGDKMIKGSGNKIGSGILGTDLNLEHLIPEDPGLFDYQRLPDAKINDQEYFVVEATPKEGKQAVQNSLKRRHIIRKDIFFIEQTDYLDHQGHVITRRTQHDLVPVKKDSWRPNMTLVDSKRRRHRSLLKILERTYSEDYVPEELFSPLSLYAQKHLEAPELWAVGKDDSTPTKPSMKDE